MAGHQGAETQVVVDVFMAINIVDAAGLPFLYKDGIRLVMTVVAGNTERNTFQSAFVGRRGFWRALFVSGNFFL
jgi:hypothetical protein